MALIIIRNRKMEVHAARPTPQALAVADQRPMDAEAKVLIEKFPNLLVPWYIMASFAYYCHDLALVSDSMFDDICKTLDEHWDDIEHMHKHVIDREALRAGTGYYINYDTCPAMTRAGAAHLAKTQWGISIPVDQA